MAKTRKSYKLRRYKTRRNKIKRNKKTLRKGLRKRRKTKKNLRGGALSEKTVDKRIEDSEKQIKNIDSLSKEELEKLKNILDATSYEIANSGIKKNDGDDMGDEGVNRREQNLETMTKKVQDKLDGLNKPPSGGPIDTDPEKVQPPSEKVVESASEEPVESASEVGSSGDAAEQPAQVESSGEQTKEDECGKKHGTVQELTGQVQEVGEKVNKHIKCITKKKTTGGKKPRKRTRKRRRKKRR